MQCKAISWFSENYALLVLKMPYYNMQSLYINIHLRRKRSNFFCQITRIDEDLQYKKQSDIVFAGSYLVHVRITFQQPTSAARWCIQIWNLLSVCNHFSATMQSGAYRKPKWMCANSHRCDTENLVEQYLSSFGRNPNNPCSIPLSCTLKMFGYRNEGFLGQRYITAAIY